MMKKCFAMLAAIPAAFLFVPPVQAAICMNKDVMRAFLSERYGEHPVAAGLVGEEVLMQLFVSDAGTWSVVLTNTQSVSCINAAGDNWQDIDPPDAEIPEY